jgi:hypothetical protein
MFMVAILLIAGRADSADNWTTSPYFAGKMGVFLDNLL